MHGLISICFLYRVMTTLKKRKNKKDTNGLKKITSFDTDHVGRMIKMIILIVLTAAMNSRLNRAYSSHDRHFIMVILFIFHHEISSNENWVIVNLIVDKIINHSLINFSKIVIKIFHVASLSFNIRSFFQSARFSFRVGKIIFMAAWFGDI